MKENPTSNPVDDQFRQTTLWEFNQGEGAITECNHDKETGDLEIMARMKVMRDADNDTKDELISLLHLDNRQCLNQLTKHLSTKSLIDYIRKDIIAEEADNITPDNEDERGGNEENFGEQS